MKTLYLVRGIPGSGKSTFAESLMESGIVEAVFEADDYFKQDGEYRFDPVLLRQAHEECQELTNKYLSNGYSVAVSNTSTTEREVHTYQKIAEKHGAKFVSLVIENRHSGANIHNVPECKIEQMKNRFSIKL